MQIRSIGVEINRLRHEPEPHRPPPPPPPKRDERPAPDDGVDPVRRSARDDLFSPYGARPSGATSLRSEDAGDARVNCLDKAVDHLDGLSPAERQRAELVLLEDTRPGAEGRTGHVVVRQGNEVVDPVAGTRYPSTEDYLRANPHYREAGTVSGDQARAIFDAPAGSPERNQAIEAAGLSGLADLQLADAGDDARYIQDKLSYGLFDWAVTDGNAADVTKRITEIADDPGRDLDEVFGKLSDSDLERWGDNVAGSPEEKRALLDKLVVELDGKNAARLGKGFGYGDVAAAVSAHASPEAKGQFVEALTGDLTGQENLDVDALPGSVTMHTDYGNDQTRAAAQVLASLGQKVNPGSAEEEAFNRTVEHLADAGKLDDLVAVAIDRQSDSSGAMGSMNIPQTSFDPKNLLGVLEGATRSNDPEVKHLLLTATGQKLGELNHHLEDSQKLGEVGAAMARLLTENTDTGAMLERLRAEDPGGKTMVQLFNTLIAGGDKHVEAGQKLANAAKEEGSAATSGYFMSSLLVSLDQFQSAIDTQKKTENILLGAGVAIAAAFVTTNPFLAAGVAVVTGTGTSIFGNEVNNGGDQKAALAAARQHIRDHIVNTAHQGDPAFKEGARPVLEAHDKKDLLDTI